MELIASSKFVLQMGERQVGELLWTVGGGNECVSYWRISGKVKRIIVFY